MTERVAAGRPTGSLRTVLVALALAQFICSFAGSNMNVMITDISEDLDTTVKGVQQGEISGLSRSISNLGSCLGTAIGGTILVAGLVDWSYGLAMISLAVVGLIGLLAALFLPANPVEEGVGGSPE